MGGTQAHHPVTTLAPCPWSYSRRLQPAAAAVVDTGQCSCHSDEMFQFVAIVGPRVKCFRFVAIVGPRVKCFRFVAVVGPRTKCFSFIAIVVPCVKCFCYIAIVGPRTKCFSYVAIVGPRVKCFRFVAIVGPRTKCFSFIAVVVPRVKRFHFVAQDFFWSLFSVQSVVEIVGRTAVLVRQSRNEVWPRSHHRKHATVSGRCRLLDG